MKKKTQTGKALRVITALGLGTIGATYVGTSALTGAQRPVAVKVLLDACSAQPGYVGTMFAPHEVQPAGGAL